MCGIIGYFSNCPSNDESLLIKMRDTMVLRGPDDAGIWWSDNRKLGLAHRRLSIIDLTPSGHQPMVDNTGQYVVILNGEIYNYLDLRKLLISSGHHFKSYSDTEVLMESYKEWGTDCLGHFSGAFAFAIYDKVKQLLFIARDRAGEKPLYYWQSNGKFVFASELKAIMADPGFARKLNIFALDYYLTYGYVNGRQSILKDIEKLAPGHAMIFDLESQKLQRWRYWSLPENNCNNDCSEDDLLSELEILLTDSVKRQLVADVPVGILLSGGLDSSLITAIAANCGGSRISTFTVSFPGHNSFDEGPFAKQVADYFGTDHRTLFAEESSVKVLPNLARQFDEPIADHSIVPTSMLAELVRQNITVALGGDGGDELFGGYPHYNLLRKIERIRNTFPKGLRNVAASFASEILPIGMRGNNHIIGLAGDLKNSHSAVNIYFHKSIRHKLLQPIYSSGYQQRISSEEVKMAYFNPSLTNFQNAAMMDFNTTMVDDYLVKSDRASLMHSLELRAPFLDYKLIEFAFGRLPDDYRASFNERKVLLRKLAEKLLPPKFDLKRKQGFTLPLDNWFKGDWGVFMNEVLNEADEHIFNKRVIRSLIKGQKQGLANANRLFALMMFELWRREYKISLE